MADWPTIPSGFGYPLVDMESKRLPDPTMEAIAGSPELSATIVTGADERIIVAQEGSRTVTDAVGEWWTHPLATWDANRGRTVFGGLSSTGEVLACELDGATQRTRRYVVGQAIVDDHCVPAINIDGNRPVLAWTNHNDDNFVRVKVGGRSGDLGSLVEATEVPINLTVGASYTQIHLNTERSTATHDVYWLITRGGYNSWYLLELSVAIDTGSLSVTSRVQLLDGEGRQCYIDSADAFQATGQTIRVGFGFNPAQTDNELYYFDIDADTGAVAGGLITGTFNVDGTGLPIQTGDLTELVAQTAGTHDRRFLQVRPGPDRPAVLYADWPTADPDSAVYTVEEIIAPDAADGLVMGASGSAVSGTIIDRGPDFAAGLILDVIFTRADPAAEFEVRIGGPTNPTLQMKALTSGSRYIKVRTNTGSVSNTSVSTPFLGLEGDTIGYRTRIDIAEGKVRQYTSTNPDDVTPTWTEIGTLGVDLFAASTSVYATATGITILGAGSVVKRLVITEIDGTTPITDIDFESEFPYGASAFTTPDALAWTLTGTAKIGSTAPDTESTYAPVAGVRVGYIATSNYIAGAAFERPSYDRALVTAHTDGTQETLKKWHRASASWVAETIATGDTADGRIVRPYPPLNGGPSPAMFTLITEYAADNFTEYAGDMRSA